MASCGLTQRTRVESGQFLLETIGGDSLPVILKDALVVHSELLTLEPDGGAVLESVTRNLTSRDPEQQVSTRVTGTWSSSGSRVVVTLPTQQFEYRIEAGGDR